MEIAWALGAGAGLATLAGFRAFIPLAIFMLMARMDWLWGFSINDTPYDFLYSDVAVFILLALVILEVVLTRVASLAKLERQLRLPAAFIAGALLMTAAMAGEVPGYWAGLIAGAALALLGVYVHRGMMLVGEGKDPGPLLDIALAILAAVVMLVPPAGYLLLLFVFFLAYRIRRFRRLKYKGLRVLA